MISARKKLPELLKNGLMNFSTGIAKEIKPISNGWTTTQVSGMLAGTFAAGTALVGYHNHKAKQNYEELLNKVSIESKKNIQIANDSVVSRLKSCYYYGIEPQVALRLADSKYSSFTDAKIKVLAHIYKTNPHFCFENAMAKVESYSKDYFEVIGLGASIEQAERMTYWQRRASIECHLTPWYALNLTSAAKESHVKVLTKLLPHVNNDFAIKIVNLFNESTCDEILKNPNRLEFIKNEVFDINNQNALHTEKFSSLQASEPFTARLAVLIFNEVEKSLRSPEDIMQVLNQAKKPSEETTATCLESFAKDPIRANFAIGTAKDIIRRLATPEKNIKDIEILNKLSPKYKPGVEQAASLEEKYSPSVTRKSP